MNAAPCAGQWELFDSTDYYDHRQARQLCDTCPVVDACRQALADAFLNAHAARNGGGPSGTWAGQLIGTDNRRSQIRIAAEEGMFTDTEARAAHTEWARTPKHLRRELTDRVRLGERVYQRRCKRGVRGIEEVA